MDEDLNAVVDVMPPGVTGSPWRATVQIPVRRRDRRDDRNSICPRAPDEKIEVGNILSGMAGRSSVP